MDATHWTGLSTAPHGAILARIAELIREVHLDARLRPEHPQAWMEMETRFSYLPVSCSGSMIDYQMAYGRCGGAVMIDISLILNHDRTPCGLWPLSLTLLENGEVRISSQGGCIAPPLFRAELAGKSVHDIVTRCLNFLKLLGNWTRHRELVLMEGFSGLHAIGHWHDQLMRLGAVVTLRHELFVDLSLSWAEIKSCMRKSFRSLITSGSKIWQLESITSANPEVWAEFKQLHFQVAGRSTRSDETWQIQYDTVVSQQGFLIGLRDAHQRLVGGGYFHVTRQEGCYAVAAYDRALFDKPLGHVVQFLAIQEMQRRGLRWYKIGRRHYPADTPSPTEKELSIACFKQGFATHILPSYEFSLTISPP